MPRDNRTEQYFWINPDHPAYRVKKSGADISQKKLNSILRSQSQAPKNTLDTQYNNYVNGKSDPGSRFYRLVEKEKSRRRQADNLARNKESLIREAPHDVKRKMEEEIDRFFDKKGPYARKIADQHVKNIANARKAAKNEKNIAKKLAKKLRYAGGVDWKSDGVDLVKDVWDKNKGKAGAGIALAGGIMLGKKLLESGKKKMTDGVENAARKGVRNYYDAKHRKNEEDQEKKAMVIPEDMRTKTEKNIRKFAEDVLPVAAAIPGTIAATGLITAGGEILRQRKREKQRAKWEEESKDRRNDDGRRYYDSNYRGGQKYKGSKPYIQGKERSRNSQNRGAVRV